MALASRNHRVLDGTLLEMIEHLVAGDATRACQPHGQFELFGVEIAQPEEANLSIGDELLKCAQRLRKRMRPRPVQKVEVEMIRAQATQAVLASRERAS